MWYVCIYWLLSIFPKSIIPTIYKHIVCGVYIIKSSNHPFILSRVPLWKQLTQINWRPTVCVRDMMCVVAFIEYYAFLYTLGNIHGHTQFPCKLDVWTMLLNWVTKLWSEYTQANAIYIYIHINTYRYLRRFEENYDRGNLVRSTNTRSAGFSPTTTYVNEHSKPLPYIIKIKTITSQQAGFYICILTLWYMLSMQHSIANTYLTCKLAHIHSHKSTGPNHSHPTRIASLSSQIRRRAFSIIPGFEFSIYLQCALVTILDTTVNINYNNNHLGISASSRRVVLTLEGITSNK